MHFTDTAYRSPYWPTWPLLQVTQGCTHNTCKFCTMYRGVKFCPQPAEWMEEDLQELARTVPDATTIQLLSANPLSEKEMLIKLKTFVENLACDCAFITHHTVGASLTGLDFLGRKQQIVAALEDEIEHGNMDVLEAIRRSKATL